MDAEAEAARDQLRRESRFVRLDQQLQATLRQQRPSSRQGSGRGYKRIKLLGKGQYGGVSLVRRASDSALYAMKAVKLKDGSAESQRRAMTEVEIWKQLKHPNVVQLEEAFVGKSGRFLYMVMSYCEAGDLRQLIRKAEGAKQKLLDEERVGRIVVQALLALDHVHSRKILHRDLKPENILLESNVCLGGWDVIKLADFGLSRQLEDTNAMAQTGVGTPYYMCPELMQNSEYNASCDIWALGCVTYELLTFEKPFPGRTMVQVQFHSTLHAHSTDTPLTLHSIPIHPSLYSPLDLSIPLSIPLSIHPSIYPPLYLSTPLSIHPSIHPPLYLSTPLSIHPSIHSGVE
jgi:NIMA (never in mitosis gene a)-related kinase